MITIFHSIENIINENILGAPLRWLIRTSNVWLQPLVIIIVLLLSAGLAFQGSRTLQMLFMALPFAVGGLILLLRWPPLGLLALIASIPIPFSGPSNSNLTFALAAAIMGLWILDMMIRQHRIQLISSLPITPLIALVVVTALSLGVGQIPWYAFGNSAPLGAQLGGLSLFVMSAGVFLVAAHRIKDERWLRWMVWFFLAMAAIFILGRIVRPLGRYTGLFFNIQATGSIFWVWLAAHSFSQAAFNKKLHPLWRGAIGFLFLGTLFVALGPTGWAWNSGWVPALAAVGGTLWAASPQLGLVAAFVGLAGATTQFQRVYDMIMVGDNSYSMGTRIDAWLILWDMVKINPILGLGPANYRSYTPLFPIRGYAVEFNSHNQYIDLLAQTGILGLTCFLWFFGAVGWVGWQLRKRVPDGFAKAYIYGSIGGVLGTLVSAGLGDWVIPFFYNINIGGFRASMLSWLFLGGLIALQQIYANPKTESTTE